MRPIVTDGVACLSVGRSVCLCHDREPCKKGWTDFEDAVWVVDSGGAKLLCIRWVPDPPCEGQFWGRKGRPVVQYKDCLQWAVQKRLKRSRCRLGGGFGWAQEACIRLRRTLEPPGEFDWTVCVRPRCELLSKYSDHWPPYGNRAGHYILPCGFYLSFFSLFFFPLA